MNKKMSFRQAASADADAVLGLYKSVVGTPLCVWNDVYPTEFDINNDLAAGTLYVLERDGSRCHLESE